jgi:pimeloyl-ACP methyl ester carboxylesterase
MGAPPALHWAEDHQDEVAGIIYREAFGGRFFRSRRAFRGVGQFVSMVASKVNSLVLPGCGHFIPEERPDAVVDQVLRLTALSGTVK